MRARRADGAPDHHLRQFAAAGAGDRRPAGDATVAQHDDLVADLEHLGQLVGDEHDPLPLAPQPTQDRQQVGDLARREIGGRLVEDQQFGFAQDRLEDLDALATAERKVGDAGIGIEVEAEAPARLADALGHRRCPQHAARLRPAEHDILDDAHRVDQHEVLVDHGDAGGHRLAGIVPGQLATAEDDGAGIRRQHAEQHLHQGALARAVLAEQAEDLARLDVEVDAVVGAQGAEATDDAAHFEESGHPRLRDGRRPMARSPDRLASMAGSDPAIVHSRVRHVAGALRSRLGSAARVVFGRLDLQGARRELGRQVVSSLTTSSGTTGLYGLPSS